MFITQIALQTNGITNSITDKWPALRMLMSTDQLQYFVLQVMHKTVTRKNCTVSLLTPFIHFHVDKFSLIGLSGPTAAGWRRWDSNPEPSISNAAP